MIYRDRMMRARDPRFAKIAAKLYGRRDMTPESAAAAPSPEQKEDDELTLVRAEYQE